MSVNKLCHTKSLCATHSTLADDKGDAGCAESAEGCWATGIASLGTGHRLRQHSLRPLLALVAPQQLRLFSGHIPKERSSRSLLQATETRVNALSICSRHYGRAASCHCAAGA
jgi:hypothetical protein